MSHVQLIKTFNLERDLNKDRKQSEGEVEEEPRNVLLPEPRAHAPEGGLVLTFDCGDHRPGRAEDVHRVEPLVFADDGLQDSQQLPETLVDSLVETLLVLCKDNSLQVESPHRSLAGLSFQLL